MRGTSGSRAVEEKLGLQDYWQIFLRRKWLIILPIVATTLIALPYSLLLKPTYMASTLLISQEMETTSILKGVTRIPVPPRERLNIIKVKIESRSYMTDVADKIKLKEYLDSIGKPSDNESIVKYLRRVVNVRAQGNRFIRITAQHPSAVMAKKIADATGETYVYKTKLRRQQSAERTKDFIEDQIEYYWGVLNEAEIEYADAKSKSPLAYLDDDASILINETAKLKTQLFGIELDMKDAKSNLANLRNFSSYRPESTYRTTLYPEPQTRELNDKLIELQEQYAELSETYTPQYPEMKNLENRIADIKDRIAHAKTEVDLQLQDVEKRIQYWQERLSSLETRKVSVEDKIKENNSKIQSLPERQLELAQLMRNKSVAEQTYSMLKGRLNSLELLRSSELQEMGEEDVRILDEAFMPDQPVSPNRKKIMIMAVALGMAIGFGTTFAIEYINRTFHSVDEISAYLGLPVLAAIPSLNTYEAELKARRYRLIRIGLSGLATILVILAIVDIASVTFFARDSQILGIIKLGLDSIKDRLNAYRY